MKVGNVDSGENIDNEAYPLSANCSSCPDGMTNNEQGVSIKITW